MTAMMMVVGTRVLPMELVFYCAMFLVGALVALALAQKGGHGE
jgi:hypothetical protein